MNSLFCINRRYLLKKIKCMALDCRYSQVFNILGIETSCDDTGCAIVDTNGNILGDSLRSQSLVHLNNGGIIPPVAEDLHRQNIAKVVDNALRESNLQFSDIAAIATTVEPGLPLSLAIGMKYGKYLCRKYNKPFIPIHHMKAHALTARMDAASLDFPFLVLLISGGHCLLTVAHSVDEFSILGSTLDDSPGEALDKIARRMKLQYLPEFSKMSGGQCIETAAQKATNPDQFKLSVPLLLSRDCNFSFSGLKNQVQLHITNEEKLHDVPPDGTIPDVYNLCAAFQMTIAKHLCYRVQRAMEYVAIKNMIPDNKRTLVVSGGVACNNFIAKALEIVCDEMEYRFIRPRSKLCTDNGVMIAWNGVEKWRQNTDIIKDLQLVTLKKQSPIGDSLIQDVLKSKIGCKWIKWRRIMEGDYKKQSIYN